MALTTETIHAAADQLHADGINPTQTSVREALGGGSYSTIGTALKSWKQEQVAHEQLKKTDMPDTLKDDGIVFIAKLWQEADSIANANLKSDREAITIEKAKIQAEIDDAQKAIATLEAEQAASLEQLRVSNEKADKATADVETLTGEIASLNTFNTDLKHKLDLESERTASANESLTATNAKLDSTRSQLDKANDQLTQARESIATHKATSSAQVADIERLSNDVAEHKQAHQAIADKLTERTAERDDLAKRLAAVNGKLEAVTEQSKQLVAERDSAVTDNKALAAANAKLEANNERLASDIANLSVEIDSVTAERDDAVSSNQALHDEIVKLRAATAKK